MPFSPGLPRAPGMPTSRSPVCCASAPPAVGSAASVIDGVLAMAEADADALAVTSDGSSSGQLQTLVTSRDIGRAFGDQPISILREIRLAPNTQELRGAQSPRARFGPSVSHQRGLARLGGSLRVSLTDVNIVKQIIALVSAEAPSACWCFCGAAGRGESLTRHAPQLVLIVEDENGCPELRQKLRACVGRAQPNATTLPEPT